MFQPHLSVCAVSPVLWTGSGLLCPVGLHGQARQWSENVSLCAPLSCSSVKNIHMEEFKYCMMVGKWYWKSSSIILVKSKCVQSQTSFSYDIYCKIHFHSLCCALWFWGILIPNLFRYTIKVLEMFRTCFTQNSLSVQLGSCCSDLMVTNSSP